MKKYIVICALVLAVLFVPIPRGTCNDGGTRDYRALTYRLIVWNRIFDKPGESDPRFYRHTSVYFGADAGKKIDDLWQIEMQTDAFAAFCAD